MSENAPAAPSRRRAYFIAAGIAFTALAVFLHFRDDSAPPPCPFPLPPRDEAAERRYAESAREFKAATTGIDMYCDMEFYTTELSTARLALIGFEPARRDIAESAKHLAAAKSLLCLRELRFPPASANDMSPGEPGAMLLAARIISAAAIQASLENRSDDAVSLLETFGPHRLQTKSTPLNFLGALQLLGALGAERDCALHLAYADRDTARIRRLMTVIEATKHPEGLYQQSLSGEYRFMDLALSNLAYFGQKDAAQLLRELPASKSAAEVAQRLKETWFALNTLPNATRYRYAEMLRAAATPEPAPLKLPEYSFFERNFGRNCGGTHIPDSSRTALRLIREKAGLQSVAATALARTALAIRLYELTHGKRPDTLAALAPDILPAVPNDPYDGQPVRYDAAKGRLWCLGKDLKDDAGDSAMDIVLHLPGCEPPDAESVFDQEKRRKAASAPDTKTP